MSDTTKVGMVFAMVASKGIEGYHSAALIADTGMDRQTVANCLQQLKKQGKATIKSGGRGRNGATWWTTEAAKAAETPVVEPTVSAEASDTTDAVAV